MSADGAAGKLPRPHRGAWEYRRDCERQERKYGWKGFRHYYDRKIRKGMSWGGHYTGV